MSLTPDPWHLGDKVAAAKGQGDTESSPHMAHNGHVLCLAKPNGGDKSRAAIEKIVSDLAYRVGFPVQPIVLWQQQDLPGEQCYCLSAWAFEPALPWEVVEPQISDEACNLLVPVFSAARAFETWISAHDRAGKHALVKIEPTIATPRVAFIDYAYSLTHKWDGPGHLDPGKPWAPDRVKVDDAVVAKVAEYIGNLAESVIREIVTRVPESFLPAKKSDIICENLLSRRSQLTKLLRLS